MIYVDGVRVEAVAFAQMPEPVGRIPQKVRTIYRVKLEVLKEDIHKLKVQYLGHHPCRRPSWVWDHTLRDGHIGYCGLRRLVGSGFDTAKEWKGGISSVAVQGYAKHDVFGPTRITLVEEVYEERRCECCGPPAQRVFVKVSAKVVRQIHPKPTVLDRLAAI